MNQKNKMLNMKKIITLIAFIIIAAAMVISCCENGNQGYGYDTQTSTQTQISPYSAKIKVHTMELYDMSGRKCTSVTIYKGEADGHSWYVFYDNLAVPAVVHDPNCKCLNKD